MAQSRPWRRLYRATSSKLEIELPANGWRARPHQRRLWDYLKGGGRRAIEIAHRRWGKDEIALHWACRSAHTRIGTYWHMLPEYEQARKASWNAVNPHTGRRRIDEAFPVELREATNDQSMFIRLKVGSTWQVIGSDNYKSLVGTPPVGIVVSEWAKAHPAVWGYLAPILLENGGWGLFITTPEGRNHAHRMYELARKNMDTMGEHANWFAELQTVEDSQAIPLALVEQQREEYHAIYGEDAGDALIEQEYWCSFSAAILGAVWGKVLTKAEQEGRICKVERTPGLPIHTAWDIGVDDPMAIWVFQVHPGRIDVLDYYESSGFDFDHYTDWLAERDYKTEGGIDWVPHDARQRVAGSGIGNGVPRTRIETLHSLGRNPKLVPDHKPMDRVSAGRKTIPLARFDADRCSKGLDCLRGYRFEWDDKTRTFKLTIKHDWTSHGGDAWGHLSVAWQYPTIKPAEKKEELRGVGQMTVNEMLAMLKPGIRVHG
jgi:phage terminase large subunit